MNRYQAMKHITELTQASYCVAREIRASGNSYAGEWEYEEYELSATIKRQTFTVISQVSFKDAVSLLKDEIVCAFCL